MKHETLTLPTGTLISGTVRMPCVDCGITVRFVIEDACIEHAGDELDGIQHTADELLMRCDECRLRKQKQLANEHRLQD